MRDDAAPGPLTPASAPDPGPPRNRQISRVGHAPGRLGREDARNFGYGTLRLTERLRTRAVLIGGVMIVIASLFTTAEQDPDFWWHLRVGRWMVENGRLPSTDLFTHT